MNSAIAVRELCYSCAGNNEGKQHVQTVRSNQATAAPSGAHRLQTKAQTPAAVALVHGRALQHGRRPGLILLLPGWILLPHG